MTSSCCSWRNALWSDAMHSSKSDKFVNSLFLVYIAQRSWLCCCLLTLLAQAIKTASMSITSNRVYYGNLVFFFKSLFNTWERSNFERERKCFICWKAISAAPFIWPSVNKNLTNKFHIIKLTWRILEIAFPIICVITYTELLRSKFRLLNWSEKWLICAAATLLSINFLSLIQLIQYWGSLKRLAYRKIQDLKHQPSWTFSIERNVHDELASWNTNF